jgi:hypothetical protein
MIVTFFGSFIHYLTQGLSSTKQDEP